MPERLLGDHDLLDLAGAFVDAEQAGVAVEALDGDAAHVAGAAVNLHGAVGDPADGLAGEVLRAGRPHPGVGPGVKVCRGRQDQGTGGVHVGLRVRDQPLDQLELRDRVTGLRTGHGVGDGLLKQSLCHPRAERGDVQPAVRQAAHGS